MPKIFVLSGPDVGMSFDVENGAALGRSAECDVPLRHASVSRRHAHLELDGASWWIVDEGSRNGLTVRGERVLRAALVDGDEFQLGEVLMRLRIGGAAPATPTPVVVRVPESDAHDEIVLEGEWDPMSTSAPASAAASTPASASASDATVYAAGRRAPSASAGPAAPTPSAVPFARAETARERATAKLAAAGALPANPAGTRGILQYNRVEARPGFLAAELGQQPWWIKLGVGVLALAVCAALAWLAFHGTIWLRGGPHELPPVEDSR